MGGYGGVKMEGMLKGEGPAVGVAELVKAAAGGGGRGLGRDGPASVGHQLRRLGVVAAFPVEEGE